MGMQGGFTKHCCILCQWDNCTTAEHYVRKDWPARVIYTPGNANIKEISLVAPKNVLMPPLHTKLGLMKDFVKQLGKSKFSGFAFLCSKFPNIREAKLKEGIFVGPQIREVLKDPKFERELTSIELCAWKHLNGFVETSWETKSHLHLKWELKICLYCTRKWAVGCREKFIFYILTWTVFPQILT